MQRNGIENTDINGLLIYNSTKNRFNFWLKNLWYDLSDGAMGPEGPVGPTGSAGKSALEVWQNIPGNEGTTVGDYLGAIKGDRGDTGVKGDKGSEWLIGNGAPTTGKGVDGDFYLNKLNGDIYKKDVGVWGLSGNIKGPSNDDAWNVKGNANTAPAVSGLSGSFIGTLDAKDFVFGSNGDERMRIKVDGKIGVNTANPQALLDVNGDFVLGAGGSIISSVLKLPSGTIDLPNIPAQTAIVRMFPVTEAAAGASVLVSPEQPLPVGVVISFARVSAPNTVEVTFFNASSVDKDPAPMNFYITVVN